MGQSCTLAYSKVQTVHTHKLESQESRGRHAWPSGSGKHPAITIELVAVASTTIDGDRGFIDQLHPA